MQDRTAPRVSVNPFVAVIVCLRSGIMPFSKSVDLFAYSLIHVSCPLDELLRFAGELLEMCFESGIIFGVSQISVAGSRKTLR